MDKNSSTPEPAAFVPKTTQADVSFSSNELNPPEFEPSKDPFAADAGQFNIEPPADAVRWTPQTLELKPNQWPRRLLFIICVVCLCTAIWLGSQSIIKHQQYADEQLGEAAAKLCNALKKTGRVVYVGCNVRPKAQKKPGSPAGTAGTAGTGPGAPPAAHQQPRSAETC